ncbi:hypothetical protein HUU62_11020 [Rhodoferax sp. 4810]|nr:hypothetical protein [Rhodoferax jenense]
MTHDLGTVQNTSSDPSENALNATGVGKAPEIDPDAWMTVLKIDSVAVTPGPRAEEAQKAWLQSRARYPAMGMCRR